VYLLRLQLLTLQVVPVANDELLLQILANLNGRLLPITVKGIVRLIF
jgi:hypothetical protein